MAENIVVTGAAGHEVTVTQAAAFGEDLEHWLTETGALAPSR